MKEYFKEENVQIFFFSFFICIITYGFGLYNYRLPIDAEGEIIYPDYIVGFR